MGDSAAPDQRPWTRTPHDRSPGHPRVPRGRVRPWLRSQHIHPQARTPPAKRLLATSHGRAGNLHDPVRAAPVNPVRSAVRASANSRLVGTSFPLSLPRDRPATGFASSDSVCLDSEEPAERHHGAAWERIPRLRCPLERATAPVRRREPDNSVHRLKEWQTLAKPDQKAFIPGAVGTNGQQRLKPAAADRAR